MNETSRRGFSLVELLVVMGIMVILTSLLAPMFNTGGKLAGSGNQIAFLVDQARQHSMSKNVMTALVLNTDDNTGGGHRAFTLLEYNAEDAAQEWRQVSQWLNLPTGIVVESETNSSFIDNSPSSLPFAADSTLPVKYQGAQVGNYAFRVFLPSGALSKPSSAAEIQLVEGSRQGSRTAYTRPGAGGAANWYRISIIGATGRGKIERP
ncbi:MAG: prepilin-type N-terminal cleavage/methylation domain-containing protein [Terrimicrobiaceae bacterium]